MRRLECQHEPDVLSAVYTNRWPQRVSDELRDHVFDCRICADVVAVASAFEAETDLARANAQVPDAAIVWWRAQLRARQAATREVVRPITIAQAIGLAAIVGVAGAVFGATAQWFQATLQWMGRTIAGAVTVLPVPSMPSVPDNLGALLSGYVLFFVGIAGFFALASLAIYVAVRATERDA